MAPAQAVLMRPLALRQAPGSTSTTTLAPAAMAAPSAAVGVQARVTRHQSTEIVQTLLHGSISCIAYLRSLFAESCFDDQFYETSSSHWPYADYAAGTLASRSKKETGTRIKVLRRGRSNAVNHLLDWLEHGAFDALQRNVLRALQVGIFEDPTQPHKVVELYTFTFHYLPTSAHQLAVAGIELTGPKGDTIEVKSAKYAMQMFVRRLIALCGTLPDLPRSRHLKMHLFYTDDCPPDYEPAGFGASLDHGILFPQGEWQRMTSNCGRMDAGFHRVSLLVAHMHCAKDVSKARDESVERETALPDHLACTAPANRADEIDASLCGQPSDEGEDSQVSSLYEAQPARPSLESGGTQDEASTESSAAIRQTPRVDRVSPYAGPVQRVATEARTETTKGSESCAEGASAAASPSVQPEDLVTKQRLRQMLEPEAMACDMEATQQQQQSADEAGKPIEASQGGAIQLSQTKLQELQSKQGRLDALRGHGGSMKKKKKTAGAGADGVGDLVRCQCGWSEDEDDMINCNFCDTWQHLHCYGFAGSEDGRIPPVHACYPCLLQGKEPEVLGELTKLALLRRAVHIVGEQGYSNDKELATMLGCDAVSASKVASRLRSQGVLVATAGSKKRGFGRTGKPRCRLSNAKEARERMRKEYLDPLTGIAHHFQLGRSSQGHEAAMSHEAAGRAAPSTTATAAARKRGRDGESVGSRAKKRVKSSVTNGMIAIGGSMTPSPLRAGGQ